MVLTYFRIVDDPFYVVRSKTIGTVVALALGRIWSPQITYIVHDVLTELGAIRVRPNHRNVYKRVVPANVTLEEARELSKELRGKSNYVRKT